MKTKKIIKWLIVLSLTGYFLTGYAKGYNMAMENIRQNEQKQAIEAMSVPELIEYIAPQYEQSPDLIKKVVWCESGFKVKSHDDGRAVNVTAIHDTTFKGWLPLYEKENGETLNINSTYDQLKMMSFVFSLGEDYRDDWTTYVAYKKGGTYTFYSNTLKGWYTVHCK